jgi:hypothetical protein
MIDWEFARQLASSATPGNTTSYADNSCQSFYIKDNAIKTQVALLPAGDWANITRDAELAISDAYEDYSVLDIEHHYNDYVYGIAQHGADIVLLIYVDMRDVSRLISAGDWQMQPDNSIKAGSITVKNFDASAFDNNESSIFLPGNRVRLQFYAGNSVSYDIGIFYIESSPYDEGGTGFKLSGRNLIGFHLASQMFDENTEYTGTLTSIFEEMLNNAGVYSDYILIEVTGTTATFSFKPADNFMSGITAALEMADWYMDDQASGRIVIGSAEFVRENAATTAIYSFNRGTEVFSRSVDRNIGNVFSRACVMRNGPDPLRVYQDVPYYDGWHLSSHKTFYQTIPDTATTDQMNAVLIQLVTGLQYNGITEKFDSPFRPWLQVGDVAYITGGDLPRLAGIISQIQHEFGENGFFTSFTVISGGEVSNPENPNLISTSYVGRMGGANRQRRLLDFLGGTTGGTAGTSVVGAVAYQAAQSGGYTGDEAGYNANVAKVADGAIVPPGGDAGQVLKKNSADDYATIWDDEAVGVLAGDVLTRDNVDVFTPDADYEPATKKYVDDNKGVSAGDVLTRDNVDVFTPDADYEPATKKYVDDNAGGITIEDAAAMAIALG